jgi:hypothetical protein
MSGHDFPDGFEYGGNGFVFHEVSAGTGLKQSPGIDLFVADNPFFPALRSGHRLFQQPSPGKQFLSSQ